MQSWVLLVVIAQFISAIVAMVDKYLVSSNRVGQPLVYAFYVSILSALSILVYAFSWIDLPTTFQFPSFANVHIPTFEVLGWSIVSSFTFFGALIALFSSFKYADASDVIPVISSTSAVATLLFSFSFLNEGLTRNFSLGFGLLVVGTLLVSHLRFTKKVLFYSLIGGVLFGLSSVSVKLLFNVTNFDDGFFWSRVMLVLAAVILYSTPYCCQSVKSHSKKTKWTNWLWIVGNKTLAGLSGLLIFKAIELGNVATVQALSGLQFVFLLLFAILFGKRSPYACGENCSRKELIQKTIAVTIFAIGFVIMFI